MLLLQKVQGGYILHTEKRFFDLDWMKKMQKTGRKWHETKVFSFGSVCRTFLVACHTILQKGVSVGLFFRPKEDRWRKIFDVAKSAEMKICERNGPCSAR